MTITLSQNCLQFLPRDRSLAAGVLLQKLRDVGVEYFRVAGSRNREKVPESRVNAIGAITLPLGIRHPMLLGCNQGAKTHEVGIADMFFTGPRGAVTFSVPVDSESFGQFDVVAESLWSFGAQIGIEISPEYSFLDKDLSDEFTDASALELRILYWRNRFGMRYLEEYGHKFFLNAPGICKELPDGSVEVLFGDSLANWSTQPASQLTLDALRYFQQKFSSIKLHRPKRSPLPGSLSRAVQTLPDGKRKVVYKQKRNGDAAK